MRLAAIFMQMLVVSTAYASPPCEMSSIGSCANANDLIWAKSFRPALDGFVGGRKVSWLGHREDIADVVQDVLSGPPDDVMNMEDGMRRFSAVRPHSATERGAIFISDDGTIRAVGVLHFNCVKRCEPSYSLSIILANDDRQLASMVRAWGDEQTTQNAQSGFEKNLTSIGRVEVLIVKH